MDPFLQFIGILLVVSVTLRLILKDGPFSDERMEVEKMNNV
jgi:hypothetical protein